MGAADLIMLCYNFYGYVLMDLWPLQLSVLHFPPELWASLWVNVICSAAAYEVYNKR